MTTSPAAIYNRLQAIDRADMSAEARAEIESIMFCIMHDLRASAARTTEANAARMIAAMLKENSKRNDRKQLHYTWIMEQNGVKLQCATDGFRAFRFVKHLDKLPTMPDDVPPLNLQPLFDQNKPRCKMPVPYIDRADVKAFIELQHAESGKTPEWDLGPGLPAVNAVYLYELLTIYPDAKLFADPESTLHPVYAVSEFGDALLLPIRSAAKQKQEAARNILRAAAKERDTVTLDQFATISAAFAA